MKEYSKILKIEKHKDIETYDITVKNNHNFFANGFVVHNCFQEQAMSLASNLANVSNEDLNNFRKLVSKKPKQNDPLYKKFLELKDKFVDGSTNNGLDKSEAEELFDKIEEFAKYSFNLSHATSYGINSYICAHLLTYYPQEWLCAYIETYASKPDKKAQAISEIKSLGYKINKLDVNSATDSWSITDETSLMPSITSCKGVGQAAYEELKTLRPFKSIYDLLWYEDGTGKTSKFNKRCMDNLLRIEAFDSFDMVGEGKLFSSYAHAHHILINNWDFLRKKLKKDTFETQVQKLQDLINEIGDVPEWSLTEKLVSFKEITGETNIDYIIPEHIQKRLYKKGYQSIEEFPDDENSALIWFVVDDFQKKKTKSGKSFATITASGLQGKQERINCWNWTPEHEIRKLHGYIALVKRNDFGYSTSIGEMQLLPSK